MSIGRSMRTSPADSAGKHVDLGFWIGVGLLAVAVLAVGAIRLRLLTLPFERDEGEYAYMGQLMLQGIAPYDIAYNMKLPGTYAAYAIIMALLGQTTSAVHLGVLILNGLTGVMVYAAGRCMLPPLGAGVAGATFLVLSVCPSVLGLAAHATHFVTFFAMGGTLLLLHALKRDKLLLFLLSGICFGLAVLMKQAGVFFGLFGGVYLALAATTGSPSRWQRIVAQGSLYSVGAMLPVAATLLALLAAGVFQDFWLWTFSYAKEYAAIVSLTDGWKMFRSVFPRVVAGAPLLWLIGGLGPALLFVRRELRHHALFLCGFLLFSFLAVCPGFYFRPHYWIVALPAVGLMAGVATTVIDSSLSRSLRLWNVPALAHVLSAILVLIAIGHTILVNRLVLLKLSPIAACRRIYGSNPFPESLLAADFIRRSSTEDATVAILGSEPQILFYASRRSATGYLYTYALMEPQPYALEMQKEMTREIEENRPEFIVLVSVPSSWLMRPTSEKYIFQWFERYRRERLELVGSIEILPNTHPSFRRGPDAMEAQRRSSSFLAIFKEED